MRLAVGLTTISFLLTGCFPDQDPPTPGAGSADFSSTIYMGGSALAGYRNGALSRESQQTSISALLARQFQQVGAPEISIPLMPEGDGLGLNPKPWESIYQTASQMGDRTDCEGEVSLGPVKTGFGIAEATDYLTPLSAGPYNLLAVPGVELADWRNGAIGTPFLPETLPFYARFATNPGISTMAYDASLQNPSFLVAWPGLQDIINYATSGAYGVRPDINDFRSNLDVNLGIFNAFSAKGVIATLPKIETLPFFTTIPARGLELDSAKVADLNPVYAGVGLDSFFVIGTNGFVIADSTQPMGIRQMYEDEFLCLTLPLDSVKCNLLGVLFQTIPDRYSLVRSEIDDINLLIDQMNNEIRTAAANYDLAVAEMGMFFDQIKSGYMQDGMVFSSEFASGNFFGLDGLYPTAKGAALIANQFILAINEKYYASIPTMRMDNLNGVLFP